MGVLLITHDLVQAAAFCDRLAVLVDGRLVADGPTPQLLRHPNHPWLQAAIPAARSFQHLCS